MFWYGFEPETLEPQMHTDGKEIEKKCIGSRGQKRKVENGNNQLEDEFNADNEHVSEILQTNLHKKLVFEFQKK